MKAKASLSKILKVNYGLSWGTIRIICWKVGMGDNQNYSFITNSNKKKIIYFLDLYMLSKSEVVYIENLNLLKYQKMQSYTGFRHLHGLPVNGQRTKTNAKSCRSKLFHTRLLKILSDMS